MNSIKFLNEGFSSLKEDIEIFHNSNGINYEVLERSKSGENALLKSMNPKDWTPYIVAWNCPKDHGSWGQGHYFQYEQDARELWNSDYVDESLDEGLMSYEDIWGQTEEDPYEVAKQFNLTCEKIPCSDCASDETKYKFSGKPADFEKARKAGFFYSIDFDESLDENSNVWDDEDLGYEPSKTSIIGAQIGDTILDRKTNKNGKVIKLGQSGNDDLVFVDFGKGIRKINAVDDAQRFGRYEIVNRNKSEIETESSISTIKNKIKQLNEKYKIVNESLDENYDEDLFDQTWSKLPSAVKDTMDTGWGDPTRSEMSSTRYARGYIQALVDCDIITDDEAYNLNMMNDENGNYVRESIRPKIIEQLNRLQEKEMSDEDKRDNEILRSILQKTAQRSNAKLTPEEQEVLNKYNLYRDGYKGISWIGQDGLDHIANQMDGYREYNSNINLADRARKWKDRQGARNIRKGCYWENPDPKNMSNGEYATTFQDRNRESDAFLMHEPVRNMKNALKSRKYHQNELNNIDTKYQVELDKLNKQHEFDKKYHQDSVNSSQKDIDKLLKHNKNNSEEK